MKLACLIALLLVTVPISTAATFFTPPYSTITVKNTLTGKIYQGQLIAYASVTGITETDGGLNPYLQGTLTATDTETNQAFTISDMVSDPLQPNNGQSITETVANTFEVLLPNGNWYSGNGKALAIRLNGFENGNPLTSTNTYNPYFDLFTGPIGSQVNPQGRLYLPTKLITPETTTLPTPLGATIFNDYKNADQDGDILAFESSYPGYLNAVLPMPINGICTPITFYTQPMAIYTTGECAYYSRGIYYVNLANAFTNEMQFPLRAGTAAITNGITEGNPSVFGTTIAYHSNKQNPGANGFDIILYDTLTNTEVIIPDGQYLQQMKPSLNNGYVAYLEWYTLPILSGNVNLYYPNGQRTMIAQNGVSVRVGFDTTAQKGLVVWEDTQQQLRYVLFDSNGRISMPYTVPLPPGYSYQNSNNIAINQLKIIYTPINFGQEIWEYNTQNGQQRLIYAHNSFMTHAQNTLRYGNNKLSILAATYTTGPYKPIYLELQPTCTGPCSIYDPGSLTRNLQNVAWTLDPVSITVPKNNPSNYAGILGNTMPWVMDTSAI